MNNNCIHDFREQNIVVVYFIFILFFLIKTALFLRQYLQQMTRLTICYINLIFNMKANKWLVTPSYINFNGIFFEKDRVPNMENYNFYLNKVKFIKHKKKIQHKEVKTQKIPNKSVNIGKKEIFLSEKKTFSKTTARYLFYIC
jgi:hypothetical protein